ncbi:GmrSD restriction endonuclease domain-containing protein [Geoglobus acetivorans]|uniref:DUF262 domain-containing protein n=1 Tax=Geoglobus acetivorans TaxID=565033 RepID=A0ABZ3H168_GEOAI|nr:DUF262 domain-containing protein [Geoglobus acetivorans]
MNPPKIKEIIKDIKEGKYNIPEFQRGFVWSPQQVRDLAESIWKEYPIGVILVWEGEHTPKVGDYHKFTSWILDGQQRMTSFCILYGIKPPWWNEREQPWDKILEKYNIMVKVNKDLTGLEFAVANPVRKKDRKWIPIRELLNMDDEKLRKLVKEISTDEEYFPEGAQALKNDPQWLELTSEKTRDKIRDLLKNLKEKLEKYEVTFLKTTHDVDDVIEIFDRVNTKGTKVKEADIMVALLSIEHQGWIRDEFLPFLVDLKEEFGFELDPNFVIRMLSAISPKRTVRLSEVGKEFWSREFDLNKYWKRTRESLTTISKILNDFGILSTDIMVSKYVLIPLVALYEKFEDDFDRNKALYWFILATWDGRYSSMSATKISEDLKSIGNSVSFEDAIKKLLNKLQVEGKIKKEDVLKDYTKDRFMRFLLYLTIYNNGAIDWKQKVKIGFVGKDTRFSEFKPQWHHFFPKNVLKKYNEKLSEEDKIREEEINSLANITILNPKQRVFKTEPHDYIKKHNITEEMLKQQFIPVEEELWHVENYRRFLERRAELLVDGINRFLDSLRKGLG